MLFISCTKDEKVVLNEDFIFGFGGMENLKMLKFKNDTVYISKNYPSRIKGYYYLIDNNDKNKINDYLKIIETTNFRKEYINDNVVDGLYYQFEFLKNKKNIYVQNFESAEIDILTKFADYLINLSSFKNEFEHSDLKIDFGNTAVFFKYPEPCPFE
jgi:glycerophosphoryl diester phosphodiesterase